MNPKELWTVELKNGIHKGIEPIVDPFDENIFYISDGWGSAYPSMKLRRLSFVDGKELNSVPIKNVVRCLYFNPDKKNIFAVSDSKIFQIDRTDFSILKKYEKGIQKYSDYISSNDKDTLLLMNYSGDFLFVYNYIEEKGIKKKIKSCRGILKETRNTFLIFSAQTGTVIRYNPATNKSEVILKTEIYYKAHKGNSGKFYFHTGKIIEATSNTHEHIIPTRKIIISSISDTPQKTELSFDFDFDRFLISENEEIMYLIKNNCIWIYSFLEKQIITKLELNENTEIAQIFDKQKIILSYGLDEQNKLTCRKF